MSNPSIDQKLRKLNAKELEVLYWKCHGLTRNFIAEKMAYGEDMIQVFSTNMWNKLEFDYKPHPAIRKKIIDEQYCPALMSYGRTLEEIKNNLYPSPAETNPSPDIGSPGWMITVQDNAREDVVQEMARAIQQYPDAKLADIFRLPIYIDLGQTSEPPGGGGSGGNEGCGNKAKKAGVLAYRILVPFILMALVAVSTVFMSNLHPSISVMPSSVVTQLVTKNITVVAETRNVTQVVTQVTQVVTQVVTQFITQVVTEIAPTPKPPETETPAPTSTTTPIPVNFAYEFKNGFPGPFTPESGDAFVVGDYLTSNGRFQISYGDIQWTDYQVEIDALELYASGGMEGDHYQIDVRALDTGNSMRLTGPCNGMVWQEVINGNAQNMAGGIKFPCGEGRSLIYVQGDKFWTDGSKPLTRPGHPHGKVYFTFDVRQKIKGIKILPLP